MSSHRTKPSRGHTQSSTGKSHESSTADLPIGVADIRELPDPRFLELWDSIVVDPSIKSRLLNHAALSFTLRPRISRAVLPLHGIILLTGVPGTGKTSLGRGLAARTAEVVQDREGFRYIEVDPHALVGSMLGKSQRAVTDLFRSTLVERAMQSATIVLLDEVETLVADRTKMSLQANPVDVHRATDAALVELDRLAEQHGRLLFIATSNFPSAIDAAFTSRADLVVTIPLPDENARLAILRHTLSGMASELPALQGIAASPDLLKVARATDGLDGRTVRKLVAAACAEDTDVALEPERLTMEHLLAAARAIRAATPEGRVP